MPHTQAGLWFPSLPNASSAGVASVGCGGGDWWEGDGCGRRFVSSAAATTAGNADDGDDDDDQDQRADTAHDQYHLDVLPPVLLLQFARRRLELGGAHLGGRNSDSVKTQTRHSLKVSCVSLILFRPKQHKL